MKTMYLSILMLFVSNLIEAQTSDQLFQQALLKENGEGDLKAAVVIYEQIVSDVSANRELRAKAQLHIGMCWEKMGKQEAELAYQKVVEDFADQMPIAHEARTRIIQLTGTEEKIKMVRPGYVKILETDTWIHNSDYSPNGRWITWLESKKDNSKVWIKEINSRKKILVAENIKFAGNGQVKWSSSGEYISLLGSLDSKSEVGLWMIPINQNSGEKTAAPFSLITGCTIQSYDWHPNGSSICLSGLNNGKGQIAIFSLADKKLKWIECDAKSPYLPRWAKDGTSIYFADFSPSGIFNRGIYNLNLKTKIVKPIVVGQEMIDISYDGEFIASQMLGSDTFAKIQITSLKTGKMINIDTHHTLGQNHRGLFHPQKYRLIVPSFEDISIIHKINLSDGITHKLTDDKTYSDNPLLSPNGDKLIYFESEPDNRILHIRDIKSESEKLFPMSSAMPNAELSPNGKYIVYKAAESEVEHVKIFDLQTYQSRTISTHKQIEWSGFSWSHDSKSLAYTAEDNEIAGLFITSIDGKSNELITSASEISMMDWFNDDERLMFVKSAGKNKQVIIYSKTRKEETVLLETEIDLLDPLLSPDEKWFVSYAKRSGPIYISSLKNPELIDIGPKTIGYADIPFLGWLSNSTQIVAFLDNPADASELHVIKIDNSEDRLVSKNVGGLVMNFMISKDDDIVYYDATSYSSNILWEIDFTEAIKQLK